MDGYSAYVPGLGPFAFAAASDDAPTQALTEQQIAQRAENDRLANEQAPYVLLVAFLFFAFLMSLDKWLGPK